MSSGPVLKVHFLGTGSSWPSPDRYHCSIVIEHEGKLVMWDCGEAAQIRLQQCGLSAMKIDNIFITHMHGDHFYGLPGLVYSLSMAERERPLNVYGPPGSRELKKFLTIGYNMLPFEVNFNEVGSGLVFEDRDFQVFAQQVDHHIPALAYKFMERDRFKVVKSKIRGLKTGPWVQEVLSGKTVKVQGKQVGPEILKKVPGRVVVYSGDCVPSKQLVGFARGADLLIHESSFSGEYEDKAMERFHSTAAQAARIAKEAGVKKLVLTHFSRRYESTAPLVEEARKIFQKTVAGKDLMVIRL